MPFYLFLARKTRIILQSTWTLNKEEIVDENKQNNVDTQQQEQKEDKEVKTFTQEDVDRMLAEATKDMLSQDKVNEIVEKRLAREKEKYEKEKSQAEELAKLSAEERKQKEFEIEMTKKNEEYAKQMAEFNKMKTEFEKTQLLAQIQKELSDRNLPISMANQMLGANAEESMKNIQAFEENWKTSLQKALDEKIKNSSSSPKTELKGEEGKTKDVKDMNLSEYIEFVKKQQQ